MNRVLASMLFGGGTTGQVLTSTGPSTPPVFANPAAAAAVVAPSIIGTYGAVGDGVADDRAAFVAADTAGKATFLPAGTYKISTALTAAVPLIGYGVTFDFNGQSTYMRNFTDLGRRTLYRKVYRDASEYTGTPTSYTNLFDYAGFHLAHYSTLGYQQLFTSDSGGRTMQPGFSVDGSHSGYGDVCAFYGNYGVSKHASSASISGSWTGANSGTVTGGQISALSDKVNLYGCEYHLDDGANATVAALGAVYDFKRESITYSPYNTLWAGVRVQTSGSRPIDVGFQLYGKAQVGLDFSGVDFTLLSGAASKCAIALKADDRINFNVGKKTVPTWHAIQDTLPPETYMVFDASTLSFCFVHDAVIGLKTNKTETVVTGGFQVFKGASLIADFAKTDATKLFLGNSGYNVSINQKLHLTSQTTASSATAGVASALPAAPFTYLQINIDGTNYKIPVYNN